MRKLSPSLITWILLISVLFAVYIILSVIQTSSNSAISTVTELRKFSSDFKEDVIFPEIYNKDLSKSEKYIAYSGYSRLGPGEYTVSFFFTGETSEKSECSAEIVSGKGKNIESGQIKQSVSGGSVLKINFTLDSYKEVEPRVIYLAGSKNIKLRSVRFEKIKNIFPAGKLLIRSLYLTPIFFLALLSLYFASVNDKRWKLILAAFLTYTGIFLIIKFAWMSEDALITLRHVDNFLSGNGALFNPGERVEGYTHTLWFWLITLLRGAGLPPKGALVLPGVLFSAVSLYLLFFVLWKKKEGGIAISFSGAVLIGMSSFIDFGTSGLESSLSYLLLIIFVMYLTQERWREHPVHLGLIVTLMTFNRPDFGIFLIFGFIFYIFQFLKKKVSLKSILHYGIPPAILLGIYEIFRMGYYGAVFPNPFFAKSGSSSYYSQGFIYLGDLLTGSALAVIFLLAVLMIYAGRKEEDLTSRMWILGAGLFYGFFVIRGGGDFMHGRFLLPAVILITISSSGAFDKYFRETAIRKISAVILVFGLILISLSIQPVQKKGNKTYNHGIADERFTFYGNKIFPLNQIMKDEHIFMWKTIGKNYRFLTEQAKKKIKVAYHTVGFIGYYSGPRVHVLDRLGLTDPLVARRKIVKRGRPGHEKSAPFGYLVYRKLTFGETPFSLWNNLSKTDFGILWDISRGNLNKFSFFLPRDFKQKLDTGIVNYVKQMNGFQSEKDPEFLFFLKRFWYPHAGAADKEFFNSIYDDKVISERSETFRWIEANRAKIEKWDQVIKGRMTLKKFLGNIKFAISSLLSGG